MSHDRPTRPPRRRDPAAITERSVDAFLDRVGRTPAAENRGRLMFAVDATASRQPTWDAACHLQMEMFRTAGMHGGLDLELCFFRGHGEFRSSGWVSDGDALARRMEGVRCRAGLTQIERVLRHALRGTRQRRIGALALVGDCVEEDADALAGLAGELGLLGTPVFAFHEGGDAQARELFRQLARASGGAFAAFDAGAVDTLRELLQAAAAYAAGGREALAHHARAHPQARRLLEDLG